MTKISDYNELIFYFVYDNRYIFSVKMTYSVYSFTYNQLYKKRKKVYTYDRKFVIVDMIRSVVK